MMFFGGEPLINFEAIEATCKFFIQSKNNNIIDTLPRFTMVTNATLLDNKKASILAKYNIEITVSIDGDKFIHDKLRVDNNNSGSFDNVVHGIELLIKNGVKISSFEVTYTRLHAKLGYSRKDVVEFLNKKFGDIEVIVIDCNGSTEYSFEGHIQQNLHNEIPNSKPFKLSLLRMLYSEKEINYYCNAGRESFIIIPNGDIYPCHKFIGKNKFKLGNIREEYFFLNENFVQASNLIKSVDRNVRDKCKNCWARKLCIFCPGQILVDGEDNVESNNDCEVMKYNIKKSLGEIFLKEV